MVVARRLAEEFGIRLYDVGRHGIAHQLILEEAIGLPGSLLATPDSHTCAAGALNCSARGLGIPEILHTICKGTAWYMVCPTVLFELTGKLNDFVYGKDLLFYIAGTYGDFSNHNLEFNGPAVEDMRIEDRHSLSTMCAELGVEFVMFPADEKLISFFRSRTDKSFEPVSSDPDAAFAQVHRINVSEVEPLVALPHSVSRNTMPIREIDKIEIQQAFIGSCANGSLQDMAVAAKMLEGKAVAPGVRLIVTPASQRIYREAIGRGYIQTLVDAGAVVTNPSCGPCFGYHMGVLGKGERCISSSPRNFKGRMGSPEAEIFLASPASVAAAAVKGRIVDPREV
jgi:3-isopropylmalate/(R)-2-methylmalate dehydratase large subunit